MNKLAFREQIAAKAVPAFVVVSPTNDGTYSDDCTREVRSSMTLHLLSARPVGSNLNWLITIANNIGTDLVCINKR